ncbi:MAG: hypothetical protein A2W05_10690 [Candidatus Schekmanbacteria bacterium RBG_16_38_10]|uniref:Uncharacterized protein n=1 Tax=Candidatus Schekmanbacteria bacterium RBG_16_38_10 TaxID=1817879 RepID=A0A1F7RSB8_9BACT|nr:MAG: hypothetical protein A2W05_10690 [Candidatus Schekmanbacteria bacterium RBG_16_38_10]
MEVSNSDNNNDTNAHNNSKNKGFWTGCWVKINLPFIKPFKINTTTINIATIADVCIEATVILETRTIEKRKRIMTFKSKVLV